MKEKNNISSIFKKIKNKKVFHIITILIICLLTGLILGKIKETENIFISLGIGLGIFIDAMIGWGIVIGMSYATKKEGMNFAFLASIIVIIRRIYVISSK